MNCCVNAMTSGRRGLRAVVGIGLLLATALATQPSGAAEEEWRRSEPDVVVIQDPTLLHQVDVFGGLRDGGIVLINTARDPDELGLEDVTARFRLLAVPATDLAREHRGRPLPGAPLLGALCAITPAASIEALVDAIRERSSGSDADGNVAAAQAAHELEAARC